MLIQSVSIYLKFANQKTTRGDKWQQASGYACKPRWAEYEV